MEYALSTNEQIEKVRQAVMKRGGSVTVGDIISETGLDTDTARKSLNELIKTHEGTLRVSSTGELLYAFAPGVVLRDQRTWWERNRETVLGIIKKLFKIIIFLVLVIYFIIYMIILLAILFGGRNNNSRSNINFNGVIWFFWGRGGYDDRSYEGKWNNTKREPIYTRVYNFVFGPEEPKVDPLEERTRCAQLIRAKNGVVTVEDWMVISGKDRKKCESDLAKYTAEFDGTADILDDGTLVYVFEDVMKSMKPGQDRMLPARAWSQLEKPRRLTANEGAGNALVIGLNTFNLVMAFACWRGIPWYQSVIAERQAYGYPLNSTDQLVLSMGDSASLWLAVIPLIFSALIFAGPLVRLPGNIKENRERRQRSLYKAMLGALFEENGGIQVRVSQNTLLSRFNMLLRKSGLDEATMDEFTQTVRDVCDDLGGEIDPSATETTYLFRDMLGRFDKASKHRKKLALGQQSLGHVVFSSNNDEQDQVDQQNMQDELDDFDRALQGDSRSTSHQASGYGYGGYSGQNANASRNRNNQSGYY